MISPQPPDEESKQDPTMQWQNSIDVDRTPSRMDDPAHPDLDMEARILSSNVMTLKKFIESELHLKADDYILESDPDRLRLTDPVFSFKLSCNGQTWIIRRLLSEFVALDKQVKTLTILLQNIIYFHTHQHIFLLKFIGISKEWDISISFIKFFSCVCL